MMLNSYPSFWSIYRDWPEFCDSWNPPQWCFLHHQPSHRWVEWTPRPWFPRTPETVKILIWWEKIFGFQTKNTWALQKLDFITNNLWLLKSVTMAWQEKYFTKKYSGFYYSYLVILSETNTTRRIEMFPHLSIETIFGQILSIRTEELKSRQEKF